MEKAVNKCVMSHAKNTYWDGFCFAPAAPYTGVRCSMYTAIAIALVVGCFALILARSKHKRRKQQEIVESYVIDIFSTQSYRPEVRAGYTYGIPSFTLKFRSDNEKEHAISHGLTKQFVRKVQDLCGNLMPRNEAFDAERAVAIYSEEDEQRWAEASAYRKEREK